MTELARASMDTAASLATTTSVSEALS